MWGNKVMKKILFVFLFVILITSMINTFVVSAALGNQQRVIVLFKDKDKIDNIVGQAKGVVNREFKNIPAVALTVPAATLKSIQHDPNVQSVTTDVKFQAKTQTPVWGIQDTNTVKAWESGYTGKGVKVAVLDTGVGPHKDLVVAGGMSFVNYTTSYADDNGHGTHVAGIIGAKNNNIGITGVAPDASIYAVKVLDRTGSGYMSDILAGIDWAITNHMDIINLSFGTQFGSPSLYSIMNKAYSKGLLIVAAAGNEGTVDGRMDTVSYPACYDSTIAAAAVDSNHQRAAFSSTGNAVEVAAPGVSILSTYLKNEYVKMSGTSMAAAYVTGELALLKQANPTLANTALRSKLDKTAKDLGLVGKDIFYGYGLVQAPTSGNLSKEANATAKDKLPPVVPKVNPISDRDKTVTGTAEAGSTVTVKAGSKTYKVTAKTDGTFTVTIDAQKAGTMLIVTATDKAGNVSRATSITVQDKTAPLAPKVNVVSDRDKVVMGTAEAGATVTVKAGTKVYKAIAKADGTFMVTVDAQKAVTVLTVTATDKAGNVSGAASVTVQDKTAPGAPKVNAVSKRDKVVTGTAEAGATITVKAGVKTYKGTVRGDGTFTVAIDAQKAGTVLMITATDKAGNISATKKATVGN